MTTLPDFQEPNISSEDSDEINFEYNKTWFEHIWADSFA